MNQYVECHRVQLSVLTRQAFFNVMLKEMGVRGVKVQEMVSIDEDGLAMLP